MRKFILLCAVCCTMMLHQTSTAQTSQKWFTTYYATWSMMPLGVSNYAMPPWEMDYRGLTHIVLFDNGNVTQTAPYWAYMFGPPPARPTDTESDSLCVEYNAVAAPGDGVHRTSYMDSLITIAHRNGVKVVITIQAVNPVNLNYVTADSGRAQLLVNTLVAWAERKKFDGVELDWEGWASPLPAPSIINRFMRILYRGVHAMKTVSGAPGLIMVSAGSGYQSLYDPAQDYIVDQFNLQLYDYAYAWYGKISAAAAWHISPLHRGTVDPTFEGQAYDTRGPLQWVAAGHDPKRIGLGIPTYGYILRNVDALFQPMTSNADYGSAHYQVIEALKANGGVEEWDDVRKVRSIHGTALRNAGAVFYGSDGINAGQKFYAVGENPQSIQEKVNWMNANNFGGIMTYDFVSDLDPTQSIQSGLRNPLQRAVAAALGRTSTTPPAVVLFGTFASSSASLPSGGGSVTLTWTSSNAIAASIDQGVGSVALSGSISVNVAATKTYTLTLTGSNGAVQQYQVTIDVATVTGSGAASKTIYGDNALSAPWSLDGTYSATFDCANTEAVNAGATSLKFTASGWAGISFRNGTWASSSPIDPSQYESLHMAINGGATGASLVLSLGDASGTSLGSQVSLTVPANTWTVQSIPMSRFTTGATPFTVITMQLAQGAAATFYVDDVSLVGKTQSATQSILLAKGWNMVSTSVKPSVMPVDSLTRQLMPAMTIVKNNAGQMYWPSMSVNTLGLWDVAQGYMVYMQAADTLMVSGTSIQPDATPIALAKGWNLSPYLRTSAMNVATAAASVGSALTIVKNNAGLVYWPAYNINTLGMMAPGQAYQFYVGQASTLLYPSNGLAKTGTDPVPVTVQGVPVHYPTLAANSGDNETILIKTQGLADGDEIAVKTASNVIAGTGVIANNMAVVAVWADDPYTTNVVEGALAGQRLLFTYWSKADGLERTLAVSHVTDAISGTDMSPLVTFAANGLVVVQTSIQTSEKQEAGLPTEYSLGQNYPNPFNPSTQIRYALPAEGRVTLELFTMLGSRVAVLVDDVQSAGMHEVSFNAEHLASGVYLYRLKCGAFTATKRMTLLR